MQGRLPFFISRRLLFSTSRVNRISSSSEEALTENLSRERRRQQPSCKQNPSQNFASRKLELHPKPKRNLVTNPSFDESLPEVEKCIWAVERLSKGKKYTALDRKLNRVPGYVCEQDSPDTNHVLISMDKFQMQNLLSLLGEERFLCTLFTLEVYDGLGSNKVLYSKRVLPRRINFDKSGEICNVGFANAPLGIKLRLDVPIHISGQEDCPGLRNGGYLKVHLTYLSLICLPEELAQYVEIHVNEMDIGDKICLGDLRMTVPLHLHDQPSLPICEIIGGDT